MTLYYIILLPRLGASLQLVVVLCIFPIKAWMVGKMEVQQNSRGQLLGWLTIVKKMKEEQATARRGGDVPLVRDPPREKTPPVAALHKSPHMVRSRAAEDAVYAHLTRPAHVARVCTCSGYIASIPGQGRA